MPTTVTSVDDLQALARARVPRVFYDYVDAGSWSEQTYRANSADLARIHFRQRVGRNVGEVSTRGAMLGQPVALPVALAPTGLTGMLWPDGEIEAARAAARFGVPFSLSTVSICSIEDIAEHVPTPFWFQLYVMKDRGFVTRLIERARAAKCSALILTLDLPIQGQRHKDLKNGLTVPPHIGLDSLGMLLSRPGWCLRMLRTRRHTFRNIVGHASGVTGTFAFAEWIRRQFDQNVSWDDVRSIKQHWGGRLIVKGIMDAEDASAAVESGADVVVVSNHGGRQLDGAPSSISALPAIVAAVGERAEVWMDGGIRSGQDVLRALALGARGTLVGRAYLYGLAAAGEAGVAKCLELLRREMEATMLLCGITSLTALDRGILAPAGA